MCIVCIRDMCCFSLVCTSKKVIKKPNRKVDVQTGPCGLEKKLGDRCVSFTQSTFFFILCCHMVIVLNG